MEAQQYISSINVRDDTARIEIAIYDPERWKKLMPDEPHTWGGPRFGYDAEVLVGYRNAYGSEALPVAEVGQGSIGACSPALAQLRIDVYQQACDAAAYINDALARGADLGAAVAAVEHVVGNGVPVATRFSYPYGR